MQTKYFERVRREQRRFCVAVSLCLCTFVGGLLPIASCTRRPPPAPPVSTLRIGAQETPEAVGVLTDLLSAEPLLVLDWHGRVVPRLAQDWKWIDEGRSLSVRLRSGVQFHDGSPLTAQAVAALLRKNIPEDRSEGFRHLASIDTPDATTLTFRLRRADSFLVEAIASALVVDEANPNIRTGPFRIVARDHGIQAERNASYYRGTPGVERVEVTLFDTQRAVFAAMIRGALDVVPEVNPESVEFLQGGSRIETFPSVRPFYIPLVFNLRHPILKNLEVRRALAQAIDREEIVRQAMRGHARIADDPIWPSHWAYNSSNKRYSYDPAAARARLEAAGFPVRVPATPDRMASRFRLNCIFYNKDFQFERIAVLLQRQLEQVGVDLVLTGVDHKTLTTRAGTGDFDSYVFQLASGKSFDWTYRFWHSAGTLQSTGYSGADGALDQLRNSQTDAEVRVAVASLRERFYEDVPAAFLAWPETTRAVDSRFEIGDQSDPEMFANLWRWHSTPDQRTER